MKDLIIVVAEHPWATILLAAIVGIFVVICELFVTRYKIKQTYGRAVLKYRRKDDSLLKIRLKSMKRFFYGTKPAKISFDYDGTLTKNDVFAFAFHLCTMKEDFEVWICTQRPEFKIHEPNFNVDLLRIAFQLEIPKERIIFTDGAPKKEFLRGFDLHLDDHSFDVKDLPVPTIGINITSPDWHDKALILLDKITDR